MSRRNPSLALGALALGLAALALAACSEAGPQRAEAQLPELQVTISPAGCGEVAVAAAGSADTAFVYTSASPSTWAHASDTHLELRARAKAGCAFTRWVVAWGGAEFPTYGTTAKAQFLAGMTATAHFSGTPATPTPTPTPTATPTATTTATPAAGACTQTTLGVDPATNSELAADCATLLAAKDALRGTATLNWDAGTVMTSWDGVTLGGTPQRVTALSLHMLRGTLPAGLGELTALTSLSVEWSKLTGSIPTELGKLTELRTLSLYRNNLGGGIPAELGKLTELRTLSLSQNFLSGGIPAELANLTQLEGLFLYQNRLTGSIPAELEKLANLASLYLSENEWTGCLPRALRAVANNDLATFELPSCPLPATTLSYDTYDTTGAVTAAGSYAFLTKADDGTMTAVTTYEGLRDGTTSALLIHKSDAGGTSRAFYDMVEAGDLFEWKQADDCFVRYTVTEVKPDPTGTVPRKSLGVEPIAYAFTGCSGAIATGSASGSDANSASSSTASVTWGALPNLGGTSLTAPIVQGPFQLVPAGWTGATKPVGPRRPARPTIPSAYTTSLAEARTFPHWREPDLPEGWTFSRALSGDEEEAGYFRAFYDGRRLVVSAASINAKYSAKEASATYTFDGTQTSVRETLQIAGRPARVHHSITDRQFRVTVHVWDESTGVLYMLRGSPDMATLIAFAESMFE